MQMAQIRYSGMFFFFILNSFLSVRKIPIVKGIIAIENLKNSNVVEFIPCCVNVRTNTPLEPNIKPARIGKI